MNVLGLLAQYLQVVAVDADDDGLLGAGQHLLDALVQVGLDVAVKAGIAVDDVLEVVQRRRRSRRTGRC